MEKRENNYAFIDGQNLYLGIKSQGWKLDYKKFRIYLKHKFKTKKAFLFLGYIRKNDGLYKRLRLFGYELIFKPVIKGEKGLIKGNIDVELTISAIHLQYNNYDKAIIVSGDGDFYTLSKLLRDNGKLEAIVIPNRKGQSKLLKEFEAYIFYMINDKPQFESK